MDDDSTLSRTYRYLRLGIAFTVVVILTSVLLAAGSAGALGSLSAYFYTSAQGPFAAALVAAALGLLALSGRGPEPVLLDAAAVVAPLVALLPTPIPSGVIDGVELHCPGDAPCIPEQFLGGVLNSVGSYLIVGAIAVLAAIAVSLLRGLGSGASRSGRANPWPSIGIAAGVLLAVTLCWFLLRDEFLQFGHDIAAGVFFLLIAAFALLSAFRSERVEECRRPHGFRTAYTVLAALIVLDVIAAIVLMSGGERYSGLPGVLLVEVVALLCFGVFWLLQTIHRWDDGDPRRR